VLGLTGMIRGHPLRGEVVLVGGVHYGVGTDLSPSVRRAVPKAVAAVRAACLSLRDGSISAGAGNRPSKRAERRSAGDVRLWRSDGGRPIVGGDTGQSGRPSRETGHDTTNDRRATQPAVRRT
jgi:hypothetical protein